MGDHRPVARNAAPRRPVFQFRMPDGEIIRMNKIDHALERMERADVHYRFVIDMASPAVDESAA
jgi:hypothetical protein